MVTDLQDVSDELIEELISNLFVEGSAAYAYSIQIPELTVPGISNFYGIHLAIWQIRGEDLQHLFPLRTPDERARYLAWCVVHGQHEYRALEELEPFWAELAKPALLTPTVWSGGISRLMQLLVLGRPDLAIDARLADNHEHEKALVWFFVSGGLSEVGKVFKTCPSWQRAFLLNERNLCRSRFGELIYRNRSDIKATFDPNTVEGQKGFTRWLLSHGIEETGMGSMIRPTKRAWPSGCQNSDNQRFGVNLIGYAYGELGIGEDVRMAALSLSAAGIPFTVINIEPGTGIRQDDRSVEPWVSDQAVYMFNIVCLTALEHLRVYVERGQDLFSGKYNIGYWPWELEKWPVKWRHCFNLIDEMWASSSHILKSAREASMIPCVQMPMAVTTQSTGLMKRTARRKFGLSLNKIIYIFSFDGNSYTKRKNPSGIVRAFVKAFPLGTEKACLVVKCMRPDERNLEWRAIKEIAERDSRIMIFDSMLTKQEVLELYESCDCFISLHRAEGFGRGIAEALNLNLEVIATGYGGNVDFCTEAGAHLIPYKLVPMEKGDYVESENNFWAEPDLASASYAIREVFAKRSRDANPHQLAEQRKTLTNLFSPSVIGERYLSRLVTIRDSMLSTAQDT